MVQAALLLAAVLLAFYIGLKQNEINRNLLDLTFSPSIAVIYQDQRIHFNNHGASAIWLWGTQFGNEEPKINAQGRYIASGSSYSINGEMAYQRFMGELKAIGDLGKREYSFLFESPDDRYYVMTVLLNAKKESETDLIISTQTIAMIEKNWRANQDSN